MANCGFCPSTFRDIAWSPIEKSCHLFDLSKSQLSYSHNQDPDQRNQCRNREKKRQEEEDGLVGLEHVDQRETTG